MNLIVDTSVWSRFLRRKSIRENDPFVLRLRYHLESNDCIHLIGAILQELLDGIRVPKQFELLGDYFEPFPLIQLTHDDFIEASRLRNHCRDHGVQAGPTDFLIVSSCIAGNYPLLTADNGFHHIAKWCKLKLLPAG